MIGIYKIQNKENGKIYIGQSNNIERRLKEHCSPRRYLNSHSPIDAAIHKYGKNKFNFDIIEECSIQELNKKETYWINFYHSNENGYNCNLGGDQASIGENNGNAKISEEDVIKIRLIYKNKGSKKEAYKIVENKTSWSNFESIWQGQTWNYIMPEVYTKENKYYYSKGLNSISNNFYSDEEIMNFRKQYVNLTAKEIYDQTDKRLGYHAFQGMLCGNTFTYLPYYMKKLKRWVQPDEPKPKVSQNRGKSQIVNKTFTDDQIKFFRNEYIEKQAKDIYKENNLENIINFQTFQKILQGKTYKHLPYYSKKNKTWINPNPVSTISESGE